MMEFKTTVKSNFGFAELKPILRGAMVESLRYVAKKTQRKFASSGIKRKTGRTVKSLKIGEKDNIFEVKADRKGITGIYGTGYYKARFHEGGATILAKKKPFLMFMVDGQWRKARRVRLRPRPFMGPAEKEAMPKVVEIFGKRLEEKALPVRG